MQEILLQRGSIATFFAYKSAGFVEKATEGELYLKMMERYSSPEMVEALRIIGKINKENQDISALDTYINQWWVKKENGDKDALEIEKARHTLKYFYRDLMQLVQARYFSRDLAKRICNAGGRKLFKNVILPMDKIINPYYFDGEYDPFNQIYNELENEQNPK